LTDLQPLTGGVAGVAGLQPELIRDIVSGEPSAEALAELRAKLAVWNAILDKRLGELDTEAERIIAAQNMINEALKKAEKRLEPTRERARNRRGRRPSGETPS
jgi:hypothetical protein